MERCEHTLAAAVDEPIAVVEYDSGWPAAFEVEAKRFCGLIGPEKVRRVEHVGSTAVPGMAAKPVIDILVLVDDFAAVEAGRAPLEAAGYECFAGEEPWFIARDASGLRVAHIHVGLTCDESQTARLLFRDRLRTHPEIARAYADLKRALVIAYRGKREAYTAAKSDFINRETQIARDESRA